MKCEWCSKNPSILTCTRCKMKTCTMCIQLESHKCSSLDTIQSVLKEKLEKQLVRVAAHKIQKV